MRFLDASTYTADQAWDALDIAEIDGATVRLHWTDQPYVWHVNDGPEVFVVLDVAVDMHYRHHGRKQVERLTPAPLPRRTRGRARCVPRPRRPNPRHRTQGQPLTRPFH